jgi:hypothetical protein
MDRKIVISQPMFLPWIGLFEQIRLADVYIHYDDVQIPQGRSFINRVQIKTINNFEWLTAPLIRKGKGLQFIKDVAFDESPDWRSRHIKTLLHNYARAPFMNEMLAIAKEVYSLKTASLSKFNIFAIEAIADYYGIECNFACSSDYPTSSTSSLHLIELIERFGCNVYITGHGARNYLDHDLFESKKIRVEYMDYRCIQYPQLYGTFTPYVSILDLIANTGKDGIQYICSSTKYWKDFLYG